MASYCVCIQYNTKTSPKTVNILAKILGFLQGRKRENRENYRDKKYSEIFFHGTVALFLPPPSGVAVGQNV